MRRALVPVQRHRSGFLRPTRARQGNWWHRLEAAWVPTWQGPGATLVEGSGHARHGILTNMDNTDWEVSTHPRARGQMLNFDGSNDYGAPPTFSIAGSALTMVALANFDTFPGGADPRIVAKGDGTGEANHAWMLGATRDANARTRVRGGGTVVTVIGSTTLSTGVWYCLASVYDGAEVRLYVDAVEDATPVARTGPLSVNTNEVAIARMPTGVGTGSQYFDGVLGPIYLWQRALADAELRQLVDDPLAPIRTPRRTRYVLPAGTITPEGRAGSTWYYLSSQRRGR